MDEHFVGKVSLRAVIEYDGKFFVCKGTGDALWQWPGGRVHMGEDPKTALMREAREELAVGPIFYTEQGMHVKTRVPQIFLFYKCKLADAGSPYLADKNEIEEFEWVTPTELAALPMWDDCRRAADEYLKP